MENLNILYNLLHILLPLSTGLTIWITTSWITGVKYLWIWTSCYLDYHGYSMHYHHFINSVNCCGKVFYCTENGITGGDINDTRNSSTAYIYHVCIDHCSWPHHEGWYLTQSPRYKMAAISQTIFSDAFSWTKSFVFWLKCHWSLFLRVQFTLNHHGFR